MATRSAGLGIRESALHLLLWRLRQAPEVLLALIASSIGALWSIGHAGPLPGTGIVQRWPIAGSVLVAGLWLLSFAVLALIFRRFAHPNGERHLIRRLAFAHAAIAIGCVPAALAIESSALLRAPVYKDLYLVALVLLCFAVLLKRETQALWRALLERPLGPAVAAVVTAMLVAAFVVGFVDLLLHLDGRWKATFQLSHVTFAANTLLLAAVSLLGFALTARLAPAILVGSAAYVVLGVATLLKITYMHAAVQPLDLLYIAEFMPQFGSTFGPLGVIACVTAGGVLAGATVWLWVRRRAGLTTIQRMTLASLSLALLIAPGLAQSREEARRSLETLGISILSHDSLRSVRKNGVLLEFLSLMPDMLRVAPEGYSRESVAAIAERHQLGHLTPSAAQEAERASVIIYMIESLMDPDDLGLTFTTDPIPNLRALAAEHSSGHAVVPSRFGESASSEFEVLTGMSMYFLPTRSVAYKQYVKRQIPSLPCLLKSKGYRTIAVQADPATFYNRSEVYEHLCFDRIYWLQEDQSVARAVVPKYPADIALVDAVITEVSAEGPAFIFAFPSSTHHPYDRQHFAHSTLDVADSVPRRARAELKYYLNTLHVADAAVRQLVDRLAALERHTVLAIVGDHLPPLSIGALKHFYHRLEGKTPAEVLLAERRVPLLVWSNFPRTRERLSLSLNLLGAHLLDAAGIDRSGFSEFVSRLQREITILSPQIVGQHGVYWAPETVPAEYRSWIEDYALLQHDALFGNAHLESMLRAPQAGQTSSGEPSSASVDLSGT